MSKYQEIPLNYVYLGVVRDDSNRIKTALPSDINSLDSILAVVEGFEGAPLRAIILKQISQEAKDYIVKTMLQPLYPGIRVEYVTTLPIFD